MRIFRLVAATAALGGALTFVACGADQGATKSQGNGGAESGDTVQVGSIHPLTGALAHDGKLLDQAVQLAVDNVNAAGGIESMGGAKIELVTGDSKGEPDVGRQEAQRMVESGVPVIIGAFSSAVTTTLAQFAARAQVPLVIDVAAADEVLQEGAPNGWSFRMQPPASQFAIDGLKYLQQLSEDSGQELREVAYMYENGNFGTNEFEVFQREATKAGIEIVAEIPYDAFKQSDFTTDLQRVKSSSPDVLVVSGYLNDGIAIAEELHRLKPELQSVFGIANSAFDLPQFVDAVGERGEGYLDVTYGRNTENPEVDKVRDQFEERFGEGMNAAAMYAYQAVLLVAAALEESKSTDPKVIRDTIAGIELEEPLMVESAGPIKFDERGENVNAESVLTQVQNGKAVQLLPEDGKQADPQYPVVAWKK